MIYRKYRDI